MSASDDTAAVLASLYRTLCERRGALPSESYTASLFHKGLDHILKKLGEEAAETIIAAKGNDREALIYELADLWFHSLVLMAHTDISPEDLYAELARRSGTSGLTEKAARGGD